MSSDNEAVPSLTPHPVSPHRCYRRHPFAFGEPIRRCRRFRIRTSSSQSNTHSALPGRGVLLAPGIRFDDERLKVGASLEIRNADGTNVTTTLAGFNMPCAAPRGQENVGVLVKLDAVPAGSEVWLIRAAERETPPTASSRDLKRRMEEALSTVSPEERIVLVLHFGLTDGQPRTLQEVGELTGLDPDRVREIETDALRRLKHPD